MAFGGWSNGGLGVMFSMCSDSGVVGGGVRDVFEEGESLLVVFLFVVLVSACLGDGLAYAADTTKGIREGFVWASYTLALVPRAWLEGFWLCLLWQFLSWAVGCCW